MSPPDLTELQPAPRHKPGRGSCVTPAERREIQLAHLRDGMNQTELAAKFGRKRETISRVLHGADFIALRDQIDAEVAEAARHILRSNSQKAAKAWIESMTRAAKKGNHKPAKDLLLHTDVTHPLNEFGGGAQVIVCIGMPGKPALPIPTQEQLRGVAGVHVLPAETQTATGKPDSADS